MWASQQEMTAMDDLGRLGARLRARAAAFASLSNMPNTIGDLAIAGVMSAVWANGNVRDSNQRTGWDQGDRCQEAEWTASVHRSVKPWDARWSILYGSSQPRPYRACQAEKSQLFSTATSSVPTSQLPLEKLDVTRTEAPVLEGTGALVRQWAPCEQRTAPRHRQKARHPRATQGDRVVSS